MSHSKRSLYIRLTVLLSLALLLLASGQMCAPPGGGNGAVCSELTDTSIDSDVTLASGCYLVNSSLYVTNGATLTLAPGVTLKFAAGKEMTVSNGGILVADGTADDSIVLTGQEETAGYWGGLRFYQSNSTSNVLDHVTVKYGGGYWDGNLVVTGSSSTPSRVTVTNSTFSNSESYGLYCDSYGVLSTFSNNTITANTLGAAWMDANVVGYLDDGSSYSGNTADEVRIWGSAVNDNQTWPGIDADYRVEGSITVSADLTIEPGAELVFEAGKQMTVDSSGTLSAVGTATNGIVFTGVEQTNGYWGGLRFYNSNSTNNQLEYVTIEYGGGYWDANLYLNASSSEPTLIDVTNCTIRYSGSNGIYLVSEYVNANADIATANTFSGNTGADVLTP